MDFPAAHLSLPREAVPPSVPRRGVASPRHPIATESALQSLFSPMGQPRCFPPQSSRLFSLFCKPGFRGRSNGPSGQRAPPVVPPSTRLTQGRLRLHTALRPRRTDAPHCRFISCFVRGPEYHTGSTSAHKNRSPRKQGRHHHAIGKRPESASAGKARLPPSTHPKLGVSSRHQRFHRCALQRIFSPSFGDG